MPHFRDILSRTMNEKGINQTWLAEQTGYPKATISRLLNGIHSPNSDTVCSIADALNVSTDYLLGRTPLTLPSSQNDEKAMLLYRAYSRCTNRDKKLVDAILIDYLDELDRPFFQKRG